MNLHTFMCTDFIHPCVCIETHMGTYISMLTYAQKHICMHTYPCIFIERDIYTYSFIYMCAHLSMHIMFIFTCMHTIIHAYLST